MFFLFVFLLLGLFIRVTASHLVWTTIRAYLQKLAALTLERQIVAQNSPDCPQLQQSF